MIFFPHAFTHCFIIALKHHIFTSLNTSRLSLIPKLCIKTDILSSFMPLHLLQVVQTMIVWCCCCCCYKQEMPSVSVTSNGHTWTKPGSIRADVCGMVLLLNQRWANASLYLHVRVCLCGPNTHLYIQTNDVSWIYFRWPTIIEMWRWLFEQQRGGCSSSAYTWQIQGQMTQVCHVKKFYNILLTFMADDVCY